MELTQIKKLLIGRTIKVSNEPTVDYATVNDIVFKAEYNEYCVTFERRGFSVFVNLEQVKTLNPEIELLLA